jgi:serine/threonine-protein kinase
MPFEATTPLQVMLKHIELPAPRPSSIVATVDAELERICLKALRKKPDARYQTARQMRAKLRAMEEESVTVEAAKPVEAPGSGRTISTVPPKPETTVTREQRDGAVPTIALVLALVAALAGVALLALR